jgi:hypothetical protein
MIWGHGRRDLTCISHAAQRTRKVFPSRGSDTSEWTVNEPVTPHILLVSAVAPWQGTGNFLVLEYRHNHWSCYSSRRSLQSGNIVRPVPQILTQACARIFVNIWVWNVFKICPRRAHVQPICWWTDQQDDGDDNGMEDVRFSRLCECKWWTSGLLNRVVLRLCTNVSEEHTTSIIRADFSRLWTCRAVKCRVRILIGPYLYVPGLLSFAVLYRQRLCDGPIPVQESCQISKWIYSFGINSECEQTRRPEKNTYRL